MKELSKHTKNLYSSEIKKLISVHCSIGNHTRLFQLEGRKSICPDKHFALLMVKQVTANPGFFGKSPFHWFL